MTLPSPVRSGSRVAFATAEDVGGLLRYLERLLRYDRRAAVRLVADGRALACFASPPFHAVTVRTALLGTAATLDTTVAAGALLDVLAQAADGAAGPGRSDAEVVVPAPVNPPPWSGMLPPRSGWRPLGTLAPGEAHRACVAAVAEFRARAASDGVTERAALDALADEVWARPLAYGLPVRAAHAARGMGLLGPDTPAGVHAAGAWLQLRTPFGVAAVRRPGVDGLRLLSVQQAARTAGGHGPGGTG